LPKDKKGVGLVSIPEFRPNFSYSTTIQQDERDNIVSAEITDAWAPMRKKSQRSLLKIGDRIKIDE
jgi:hypothetical protein